VDLAIYDCLGREVRQLVSHTQVRGHHSMVWDWRDDRGEPVRSGVYLCSLNAGGLLRLARVMVVR
jgi:hypothetical protein